MKFLAKLSGTKSEWTPSKEGAIDEWKFEKRAGGWVIATRVLEGKVLERKRFFYSRTKNSFFAKFTDGASKTLFGERLAQSAASGAAGSAKSDYTAQFPGKVRKIIVKEGDSVQAGAPLIMVEAMKMEFAIKAGSSGVVKKILVSEGAILSPGQKLLDFEESK